MYFTGAGGSGDSSTLGRAGGGASGAFTGAGGSGDSSTLGQAGGGARRSVGGGTSGTFTGAGGFGVSSTRGQAGVFDSGCFACAGGAGDRDGAFCLWSSGGGDVCAQGWTLR